MFMEILTLKYWHRYEEEEDIDCLDEIFSKLGTPSKTHFPNLYNKFPYKMCINSMCRYEKPKNMMEAFPGIKSKLALDLLKKLLCLDPKERITVQDALNHPFF